MSEANDLVAEAFKRGYAAGREELRDITAPAVVQVEIDQNRKVVWVNVDGVCVFRACRIKKMVLGQTEVWGEKDGSKTRA